MHRCDMFIRFAALGASLALAVGLCGCGGGGDGLGRTHVSGRVLDADSLGAIAGATVSVGASSATSDEIGAYAVPRCTPGTQSVECTATGYEAFPAAGAPPFEIVVQEGPNTLQPILLVPAGQQPPAEP